jgi:hypothetical protein
MRQVTTVLTTWSTEQNSPPSPGTGRSRRSTVPPRISVAVGQKSAQHTAQFFGEVHAIG